jgi:imidazolonepropionase-like amidohydrolase
MMAVLKNRDELVSVVKQTPRQIVFERNGKIISISENATAEDKARFAKFI